MLLSCFPWNATGRLVHKISAFAIGVGRNNPLTGATGAGLGAQGKHGSCHPSRVAALSSTARLSRAAGVWVRSQQRLQCCTGAPECAQGQGNANLGQSGDLT